MRPHLLVLLSTVATIWGHTEVDEKLTDQDLSLPDLSQVTTLDTHAWKFLGDAKFDAGRVLLTPKPNSKGALINDIPLAYDSWTVETIIRSTGAFGKTGSGISLRYVSEIEDKDTSFFGSAKKFDGLNVVVDSNSGLGSSVHAFLSDGSEDFSQLGDKLYSNAFGSCLLGYQDSQVPFTLRFSYYSGVFMVQVDNQVCIKTKQVKLPKNYKLSVSASTKEKHEQFELLKLKTYGGVLSEILENDSKSALQPKVVTEYIRLGNDGKPISKTKDSPVSKDSADTGLAHAVDTLKGSNDELLQKLESLDSKISQLSIGKSSTGETDLSYLNELNLKIKALSGKVVDTQSQITNLENRIQSLESSFKQEVNSLVSTVNKLSADQNNQLRENDQSIVDLSKQIEFLVYSEKEKQENSLHDVVSGLKLLIIPILASTAILSFFTYKLRHDIKTKLL